MIALPLLAAAALLSAEVPPAERPADLEGAAAPAAAPLQAKGAASGFRQPLSLALGAGVASIDGIPLTLGVARVGLSAVRRGVGLRPGFGFFMEADLGQTENGLGVGGVVFGPHLVMAGDRARGSLGVEVGTIGVNRATTGETGFLAPCLLRAQLEVDVWRFGESDLFLSGTGTVGVTGDGTFLGLGALVGVRP